MTLKELSQLYYLTREIEANEKRLEELTDLIGPATAKYSDMPKGPFNTESPTERLAAEITDLKAILAARQIQLIHERARLERWIETIPDSLTRQVFQYRFVSGLSWLQVADCIGGGNTEAGVKMICYRYLKTDRSKL